VALHVILVIGGVLDAIAIFLVGTSNPHPADFIEGEDERNEWKYIAAINGRK